MTLTNILLHRWLKTWKTKARKAPLASKPIPKPPPYPARSRASRKTRRLQAKAANSTLCNQMAAKSKKGERNEKMTDLKRLYQSNLPSRAITVYLYLRGRANKEGFCWPAIPTMARELKMSESTIRRALRDLVLEGLLVIEERQRKSRADSSNKYILKTYASCRQ